MKTDWNLKLLYKSPRDPEIKKDLDLIEKTCDLFSKKYSKNDSYFLNDLSLLKSLEDFEKVTEIISRPKPYYYFSFMGDLDTSNEKTRACLSSVEQALNKSYNKLIFFELKIASISKKDQARFLNSPILKKYKYFLERIFIQGQYNLSEKEEKIMSLKTLPARTMWIDGQQKLLYVQSLKWGKGEISIPEARNLFSDLPVNQRRKLHSLLSSKLKEISYFAESEINAIYINKKINDEVRGYKEPYSATILGYQNDEKAILSLVDLISKNFKISHKFYKLKAKLLNQNFLTYADRGARIGKIKTKINIESSVEILKKSFEKIDPKFRKIFEEFLENGQIDFFARKNKVGGAYCASGFSIPTFILLNFTNSLNAVTTMAHEMGHAFHGELSKKQPIFYRGYSTAVAETASTFFENFVFDFIFENLSKKDQIIAMHDRIQDSVSTIFRQIACFNFELELHKKIREKGFVSKEEIASLHNKNMQAYLGPICKMKEDDGYDFVYWSHIRNHFYVYSYAYGELVSQTLYQNYKLDKSYLKKIEEFLSAGSSESPENIFKNIGINTFDMKFFELGLRKIEEDIKKLEKLIS